MKKCICFLFFITLIISGFSQKESKIVNVNGFDVNLAEVDVNKGRMLEKSGRYIKNDYNNDSIYEITEKWIYVSPSLSHYLYLVEVLEWESYNSKVSYYDSHGNILFQKEFNLSFTALISQNGRHLLINCGDVNNQEFFILNNKGVELFALKNIEPLIVTRNHHKTFIFKYESALENDVYYVILFSEEQGMVFNKKYENIRPYLYSMSSNEQYFSLLVNDTVHVWDNSGNLQWSLERSPEFSISIFNNGERYLQCVRDSIVELYIKDFKTHKILNVIRNVKSEDQVLGIYKWGFIDENNSAIYVSTYSGGQQIFNFYDINGQYLNMAKIPSKVRKCKIELVKGQCQIIY